MQKTKLGISVGLLGAITYLVCYFGGYVGAIIMVGYILLFETNEWLRKTSVKAIVLTVVFSLLSAIIGLIPDAIGFIDSIFNVFGGSFHISVVTSIIAVILEAIGLIKTVIFILLGLKALNQGTLAVPVVDDITNKNI